MSAPPAVSVVIPHYRDLQRLETCLRALEAQTYPRGAFEIVVADNCSPEGEAAVAEVIAGRAQLVIARERGAGPARNAGAAVAKGRILAFTDCDCLPEPDWLARGVAALDQYDFVGGRMTVLVEDMAKLSGAEAFERVFAFDNASYVSRKGFTVTANLFCPRALFEQVGGFLVGVSEDIEWCRRAAQAGFTLGYAPGAVVGHPARRSWDELKSKWRRMNAEQYGLSRSQPGGRARWLVRNCLLPVSAVVHSPRMLFAPELSSMEQRLKGLAMLFRVRLWRAWNGLDLLCRREAA